MNVDPLSLLLLLDSIFIAENDTNWDRPDFLQKLGLAFKVFTNDFYSDCTDRRKIARIINGTFLNLKSETEQNGTKTTNPSQKDEG